MLVKHKQLVKKGKTGFSMDGVESGLEGVFEAVKGFQMPKSNERIFTGVNDYTQADDAGSKRNKEIAKGVTKTAAAGTLTAFGLGSLAPVANKLVDLGFGLFGDKKCKYSLNGQCVSKEEYNKAKKSDWQKDNQLAVNRANANLQYIPTNTQLAMKAKKGARLYKKSVEKKQDGGKMDTNFLLKPGTEIDTSSITNKLNPIVFAQLHKAMRGNKNQFAKLQK
jgi:hypothetical protein